MGVIRRIKFKKPKRAKVELGRFYGLDHRVDGDVSGYNRADVCYNFSCKDGTLRPSFGLKNVRDLYTIANYDIVESVYYFRHNDYANGVNDDRIISYCRSGNMYTVSASGGQFVKIPGLHFSSKPKGVCYNYNSKDV